MPPFFEPFFEFGGVWVILLAVLTWIAYTRLSSIEDDAGRWAAALSLPWLMKVAVILALLCWVWNFGRLFTGSAYLPGAGVFAELSTVLLVLILSLAGVAWLGIRFWSSIRPWLTHGLVLLLIAAPGLLLRDAPEGVLSQDSGDGERRAVIFIQGRLAHLGCFKAVGEPDRHDGSFEALTAIAVSAFQQANELIQDPKLDIPGVIRPEVELPLLTKPFPVLFGPKPCPSEKAAGFAVRAVKS